MARRALAAPFASPPQALAPFVPARRALQPDPLGRTVGDLRRLQVAVLGGVPKVQDARVQALGAIEALQRQPPAAVRASGIAERPRPHGQLPTVAALAAPPHSGRIAARDVGRLEGPVPLPDRYVKMIQEHPEDKQLQVSIDNFDAALSHPDTNDLENAKKYALEMIAKV